MLPARVTFSLIAACAALLAAGCGGSSGSSTTSTAADQDPPSQAVNVSVSSQSPGSRPDAIGARFLKAGQIPQLADVLAKTFELPVPLRVRLINGFGQGPFYNPKDGSITFQYQFAALVYHVLRDQNPQWTSRQLGYAVGSVDAFILEHEFAHGLIDLYDIPILGREEDAADTFATILLLNGSHGDRLALSAAQFWAAFSSRQNPPKLADYADEHSLDLQRSYEIACLIAGSSPRRYQEVQSLAILPPARLAGCRAEFNQKVSSLKQVLEPHLDHPLNFNAGG